MIVLCCLHTEETYATTDSMLFEAIPANIDEPTVSAPTGATVTAPEGGWKEGENTFSVIHGIGDNTLDPQGTAIRAQAATIFMRFIEKDK